MTTLDTDDGTSRITPVDRYVGQRIRETRLMRRMSQEKLAAAIGVSFQQVQKYEKATNRVSAGSLVDIARALDVSPAHMLPPDSADDADLANDPTRGLIKTRTDRDLVAVLARLTPTQRASLLPVALQLITPAETGGRA